MTEHYPNLGFDPAPGDPDEIASQAKTLGDSSQLLSELLRQLTGSDPHAWQGKTADALRDHLHDEVAPLIRNTRDAFTTAAAAYHSWASQLRIYQAHAQKLENQAGTAQQSAADASLLYHLGGQPGQKPDPDDTGGTKAKKNLDDANTKLKGIRSQAEQLHKDYLTTAGRHANQLNEADQHAPHKPGFFSRAWHDVTGWLPDDLPERLASYGNLAGYVAAACSLLGMADSTIPGVDLSAVPLEFFGGMAAYAALVLHGAAKIGGDQDVKWTDLTFDAFGVMTFGTGELGEAGLRFAQLGAAGADLTRVERFTAAVSESSVQNFNTVMDKFGALETYAMGWSADHLKDLNPANWFGDEEPKSTDEAASAYFSSVAGASA